MQVERNKGVGGTDGMQTDEFRNSLNARYQELRQSVTTGMYEPSPVKKIKNTQTKEVTERNNGSNTKQKLLKMQPIIQGWANYFSIAKAKSIMEYLDVCIRTRLRTGKWKEWKHCSTGIAKLLNLGASNRKAYEWSNSSKGYWRVAHSTILCTIINNAYFTKEGYTGFANIY